MRSAIRLTGCLLIVLAFSPQSIPDIALAGHNRMHSVASAYASMSGIDINSGPVLLGFEPNAHYVDFLDTAPSHAWMYASSTDAALSGKDRIHIILCGIDSRLGARYAHADANHLLSISPKNGVIDIISIPRDTPADAGYTDSADQRFNILANVRPKRGTSAYKREVARIAGVAEVDYYIEIGFSQAMGLIELLGYRNPTSTLRVLRSRRGLGGDDFQRTYNQGQFIRQAALRQFSRLEGFWGNLLIRGALMLVKTDLPASKATSIIDKLARNGFPASEEVVTVQIKPVYRRKFNIVNFSDEQQIDSLHHTITAYLESHQRFTPDTTDVKTTLRNQLFTLIARSVNDSAKSPRRVVNRLKRPFEQRAWLQIGDIPLRRSVRNQMRDLLANAYRSLNKPQRADRVIQVVQAEEVIFSAQTRERSSTQTPDSLQTPDIAQ